MYETLKYEVNGNIAIVTISREQALNALNRQVLEDLDKVLDVIKADRDLRGLVITGAGRSFVAGADIAAMSTMNEEEGFQFGVFGAGVFRKIELLDIPVVAAVNGFALGGGCELAMSTDYIVASEKAKFGQPEAGLGITPGFGGTQRLARKIGESKAKELIFSARVIGAQEAYELGIADKLVAPEELMDVVMALMASFAKNAPIAVANCKRAIDEGYQLDIDGGVRVENKYFGKCFATEDQKEGMAAFLGKRPAEFKNK
ncbi:MAG: enoyl-CoA hydratase/isomerase family protein [Firmicutes bacterium]|nr:enoyl-CoA hydratase/isomerase family protein [Bacillota bacterium]